MTQIFNRKSHTETRKKLRNNMPRAEQMLWRELKGKQLKGYKFRRQYGISGYIVDFYCPKARMVIEIDGESHIGLASEQYDARRERYIKNLGMNCLRFTNWDVYENLDGVLMKIILCLEEKTTPQPPPS